MERATKLRKLNRFRRNLPHVSALALSAILRSVEEEGLPELTDRDSLRAARNLENLEPTRFGPVLQQVKLVNADGTETAVPIAHPFALLSHAVETCQAFALFFRACLETNPPSPGRPWHLILYSDEITPGNVVAPVNNRKFWAIYWSFLEFGKAALSHEECWFCIVTEFSTCIRKVAAGLSQLFGALLKVFFSSDGNNLGQSGVCLFFGDVNVRLWAKFAVFIQDGGAHKSTFHIRGDGASKMCPLCKDLFTESSQLVDHDGDHLLRCNIIKKKDLTKNTGKELRKVARYIARMKGTADFDLLQQALGVTHHEHSLLLDPTLDKIFDPCAAYMHDWMHGFFSNGVVNIVVYLLFEAFIGTGQGSFKQVYALFQRFVSKWHWPLRLRANHLDGIFTQARAESHRKSKQLKCSASDLLSLLPVLAYFVHSVLLPSDLCNKECRAFLALVHVVDLIYVSARAHVKPGELLKEAERFLELFAEVWGYDWMIPKFHWMLHYSDHLHAWDMLLNCFCLERKHQVPKRFANDLKNIFGNASRSLLMEVTSHHLACLNRPKPFDFTIGLVEARPASNRVKAQVKQMLEMADDAEIMVSVESRFSAFATCRKKDVVLVKQDDVVAAAEVLLHCSVAGVPLTMVSMWRLHSMIPSMSFARWHFAADDKQLVLTEVIQDVVCYTRLRHNLVGTIIPFELR